MDLLTAYDRFLHGKLMNPAFRWVQKLFHWNRFQLIRIFMIIATVFTILGTAAGFVTVFIDHDHDLIVHCLNLSVYTLWRVVRFNPHYDGLKEASETFEATGHAVPAENLIIFANVLKALRPSGNAVSLLILLIFVILPPISFGRSVGGLFMSIALMIFMIECHLWDIDDIDPKDREYLFEGKRSREPAS